jgi:2,4-dienoyl-CoA reductase-like NADH-dependent reductase (Old Yellow Enzyme family)
MTEEENRFRFPKQVAEAVRANKGAFAYVFVLEQMEIATEANYQLWRDVLIELERKEDATPRVQTSTERNK